MPGSILGTRVLRTEDPELLFGHAEYVGDLDLGDALQVVFVRSEMAHALIPAIDTDAAKAAPENESAAPQSYFRATGYNVSLKKTLVFEGNYAAPPSQQPAPATAKDRERSEQNRDRARIVGTVRVNGEAAVEVDAIAETPDPAKKSER